MKQIVCEMCESTSFAKVDGMFVCQGCGTKYSVEEAKKLMVEVEGDVEAPVTPTPAAPAENSKLNNLYELARRAKENDDSEAAAKYYEMILFENPSDWEANFYTTYFKAMSCKIAHIQSAAISVSNCLDTILELIQKNVTDEIEQAGAVAEVTSRCVIISTMLFNGAKNHYDGMASSIKSDHTQEFLNNCCAARDIAYNLGDYILNFFGSEGAYKSLCTMAWKTGVEKHKVLLPYFANQALNQSTIDSYDEKIGTLDAGYKLTKERDAHNKKIRECKDEIARLNRVIANTDVEGHVRGGRIGFGIFMAICATIMIGCGSAIEGVGFIIFGVIEVIIAIICFATCGPNKDVVAKNIESVKNMKAQIVDLEAKLKELENTVIE